MNHHYKKFAALKSGRIMLKGAAMINIYQKMKLPQSYFRSDIADDWRSVGQDLSNAIAKATDTVKGG
jgi:hypothetical protein